MYEHKPRPFTACKSFIFFALSTPFFTHIIKSIPVPLILIVKVERIGQAYFFQYILVVDKAVVRKYLFRPVVVLSAPCKLLNNICFIRPERRLYIQPVIKRSVDLLGDCPGENFPVIAHEVRRITCRNQHSQFLKICTTACCDFGFDISTEPFRKHIGKSRSFFAQVIIAQSLHKTCFLSGNIQLTCAFLVLHIDLFNIRFRLVVDLMIKLVGYSGCYCRRFGRFSGIFSAFSAVAGTHTRNKHKSKHTAYYLL